MDMKKHPLRWFEVKDGITFYECFMYALQERDLVKQYNRLSGRNLLQQKPRTPFERLIDKSTGYDKYLEENFEKEQLKELKQFEKFVWRYIWQTLPVVKSWFIVLPEGTKTFRQPKPRKSSKNST